MKGQRPYQEGTPCSQCPSGYRCENSLCGESGMGWGGRGNAGRRRPRDGLGPPGCVAGEGTGGARPQGPLAVPPYPGSQACFALLAQPLWRLVIPSNRILTLQEEGRVRRQERARRGGRGRIGKVGWAGPPGRRGRRALNGRVRSRNPAEVP